MARKEMISSGKMLLNEKLPNKFNKILYETDTKA